MNHCDRHQILAREDYPHSTLGTVPQGQLFERRDSRQVEVVGGGGGGQQTRTDNEEEHNRHGGRSVTTPMNLPTIPSVDLSHQP